MKDPLYFKDELDARTKDLSEDDKAVVEESLNKQKKVDGLKKASEVIRDSQKRTLKYDLEQFLIDPVHYTTEDGTLDVLEIQIDDYYERVSGKLVSGNFMVEEFYINRKALTKVVHVEDEPDSITKIEWA